MSSTETSWLGSESLPMVPVEARRAEGSFLPLEETLEKHEFKILVCALVERRNLISEYPRRNLGENYI